MTGMVFGSVGVPLSPWHAAQSCAFASISSAACAGGMAAARPIPIPKIAERKRVCMTRFLLLPRRAKVGEDTLSFEVQLPLGEPYASQTDVEPFGPHPAEGLSACLQHRHA